MLPKCFEKWIIFRPKTKEEEEEDLKYYLGLGYTKEKYNSTINTRSEAIDILNELDVKNDAAFYEFYSMYTGIDSSENEEVDLLYSLDDEGLHNLVYRVFTQSDLQGLVIWHLGISYKTKVSLNLPHAHPQTLGSPAPSKQQYP
jgi:hypothetical protein